MIPWLTEQRIHQYASDRSYERGKGYYKSGDVLSVIKRGNTIQASVEGSAYSPYSIHIKFDETSLTDCSCSCPYSYGDFCKHLVAVFLTCLHSPDKVQERPSLEAILDTMDVDALKKLILKLARKSPELFAEIELEATRQAPRGTEERPSLQQAKLVKSRVIGILHSLDALRPSEAYWKVSGVVDEVQRELDSALDFLEMHEPENALDYLTGLTEAYVQEWLHLDDSDGYMSDFFHPLGKAWAEVVLSVDLGESERESWIDTLQHWEDETSQYGIDGWTYAAQEAIDEELADLFHKEDIDGERFFVHEDVVTAKLNVLQRQEKHEEYLALAFREQFFVEYACMLVNLGHIKEAEDAGLQHLHSPGQALMVAKVLHYNKAVEAALRVAEHGMSLVSEYGFPIAELATWLSHAAEGHQQPELALEANLTSFNAKPELSSYKRAQALSGDAWPAYQSNMLEHIRNAENPFSNEAIDIFLHENLIDDAITATEKSYAGYDRQRRVAASALHGRPDWTIKTARKHAEDIIEQGKSEIYHHAIDWLDLARRGYQSIGKPQDWTAYRSALTEDHGRKYKLMGMMKERFD
ncbi:MAG: SWIM zinc finger family protein [Rhodothermaceae bacterium]|nr:SWIM zinc finger family protein [Rhodothermaceae bacterium]